MIEGKLNLEGSYYPACEIIPDKLATWGAGDEGWDYMDDKYNLIQEKIIDGVKWPVVDCRDMEDGPGNPLSLYEKKINLGVEKIQKHGRVLVCCLAGISRSNGIAMGILMKLKDMDYIDAYGEIRDKVPYAEIEQAHLNALKKIFGSRIPFSDAKVRK